MQIVKVFSQNETNKQLRNIETHEKTFFQYRTIHDELSF